jgi:hypothetical protein
VLGDSLVDSGSLRLFLHLHHPVDTRNVRLGQLKEDGACTAMLAPGQEKLVTRILASVVGCR